MAELDFNQIDNLIPIDTFNTCLNTGATKKDIIKLYPTRKDGAYYLDKFVRYLKNYLNLSLKEYLLYNFGFEWPKCSITGADLGYSISGKGIKISRYSRGGIRKENCENFKKFCEKISRERIGAGNPMYKKKPWNKGVTADNDPRVKAIADKRTGRKASPEAIEKQKETYKKTWPKNGKYPNSGNKYSEESRKKMSLITAQRWANGSFKKESSIHIKVREFLKEIEFYESWDEEFQVRYFSFDFAFPKVKVAIEVQGGFYHVDPRIYPNGPVCAIQRRNFGRDKVKRKVCGEQEGWTIIEVWEIEINNGEFKEYLKCRLRELNLLKE